MPNIEYPYMPEGQTLKYASVDDPFMRAAAQAREECAGDPLYPVGIVLVKDGEVVARAGNGFNRGPGQVHVCPRIVLECPSGTGYELCTLHDAPGHSEPMLVAQAKKLGIDPSGADAYMYGHWWACEPCWNALIEAGVRDLYVTDDAHERFSRDKVYGQTLSPSVKTVALEGFEGELLAQMKAQLKELGLELVEENADARCIRRDEGAECFLAADSVYSVEESENIARQLRNVLRQL
jgi:deoxycytidylate deaminase